ncbi:MAG: CBS domain-containing protein [Oceanicaulis sp.]
MNASRIIAEKGGTVFTVSPGDTLVEAARTLTEKKVGAAVVVDGAGAPVGVFSERDLARVVAESGEAALSTSVADVMSKRLFTAEPAASVDELMSLMTERRIRHVIIMDGGAMAGVVSIGDVVKRKIAEAEAEAESLKAYIEGA